MQCGEKHCWCGFLDAGYRIQSIPFVGRNMTLTCPKLTLMGKDPCHMTPSPIVTCKNTRGPRLKWIYDKLQEQCIQTESCTGFQTESECFSTCGTNYFFKNCLLLLFYYHSAWTNVALYITIEWRQLFQRDRDSHGQRWPRYVNALSFRSDLL